MAIRIPTRLPDPPPVMTATRPLTLKSAFAESSVDVSISNLKFSVFLDTEDAVRIVIVICR